MKANKILLIIQTICMYLLHLPLWSILLIALLDRQNKLGNTISDTLGLFYRIGTLAVFIICILNILLAIISIAKPVKDMSNITMICKIIQVPWYVVNTIFCTIVFIGLCNPMLFMIAPIYFVISLLVTYCYMLSTSLPLFISYTRIAQKNMIPYSLLGKVSSIALFFFILDIMGSISIYCLLSNQGKETL